jgi:hypothetical protein
MKITSAFCDLHPLNELAPAGIKTLSPVGDVNTLNTAGCTNPMCNRHYTRNLGYFDSAIRERLNLGDMERKNRCGLNHEVEYMVLTNIDNVLAWACPFEKCEVTKPYGTVAGPCSTGFTLRPVGHAPQGLETDLTSASGATYNGSHG